MMIDDQGQGLGVYPNCKFSAGIHVLPVGCEHISLKVKLHDSLKNLLHI